MWIDRQIDNLGLLPYRKRIVAVSKCFHSPYARATSIEFCSTVGNPIHVEKCEKPSIEEVKRIQNLYIDELLR